VPRAQSVAPSMRGVAGPVTPPGLMRAGLGRRAPVHLVLAALATVLRTKPA